jgi:DnaJ-class molecular chaperone
MPTYRELAEAKQILGLPDRATLEDIRGAYRSLLKRWHPDTCAEARETCGEKTRQVVAAYRIISAYCEAYQYSFADEDLRRHLSDEEWWLDRFGQDPLWGGGRE